jgi:ABC-type microcin C transport system permease subunit YejE
MAIFSPLTVKRFKAFRRIRRAWWSLMGLAGIFIFTMCADFVCPCDPRAVVDPATLEKYRRPTVEKVYEIRSARFNLMDDGTLAEWEGPEDVKAAVRSALASGGVAVDGFRTRAVRREGYVRYFLEPVEPPAERALTLPAKAVSFPFRPCREHPFGVDAGGRDVYARIVHGMRIALLFGLGLTLSGIVFGLAVGAVQGYFGGVTDIALQRFTEIWSAMPFLYVMIFIGSTLGRSFTLLLVCYAIFNWITVSYYMRAEFLRLRKRTFVEAAKAQGFSARRIIFVHILPNALTPLITLFPFLLMGAIGSLAALDFLGFGLPPMTPSCGELLNQAQQFRDAWWLTLFPSLALFAVMILSVFVGEGLRDAFDPRQKTRLE